MSPSERLPLMPLRGYVLLPGMRLSLVVGRPRSLRIVREAWAAGGQLAVVAQRDPAIEAPGVRDLYTVGTLAQIKQLKELPEARTEIEIEGIQRCRIDWDGEELGALIERLVGDEEEVGDPATFALMQEVLEQAAAWCRRQGKEGSPDLPSLGDDALPGALADRVAALVPLQPTDRQAVLEEAQAEERLHLLLQIFKRDDQLQQLRTETERRLRATAEKNKRQTFLREQMRVIQEELGEQDSRSSELAELRRFARNLPDEVGAKALAEIDRLERMPPTAGEVALIRNYLDLLFDLPWTKRTEERISVEVTEQLLNREHYGLDEVKERILDALAICEAKGSVRGLILCFVGPPGVGKTSLARSIAEALGRKLIRLSLGGVKDEAEIRGHRRVYVGAQPGRFIQGLRAAGTRNPVLLLDEIDKLAADFRGDPAAALLEVLDREQNLAFRDHYLELPVDLSEVLFIATANDLSHIPAPLRDRMEVIRLQPYTDDEKVAILANHVLPRQMAQHALTTGQLLIEREAMEAIVRRYTREPGVRELERKIAQICRKALRQILRDPNSPVLVTVEQLASLLGAPRPALKWIPEEPQVGISLGLAVSEAGGSVSPFEVATVPGDGRLVLTGGLGEMMRDSAQAALSWIRSNAAELDLPAGFLEKFDLHLHMTGGAPKNGTSGGVPIAMAMLSALTGRPVRNDVAMTGEVTLRGRILPIGGAREKVIGACREGMRSVIIPKTNLLEVADLPASLRDSIQVIPVATLWEVVNQTLLDPWQPVDSDAGLPLIRAN